MVNQTFIDQLQSELAVRPDQIKATLMLLNEGGTVPFIARYRKEATGGLDEVTITAVRDRFQQLVDLEKRREAVLKSIADQKLLTPALEEKINQAATMAALEDLYLPYKPKRKTRASVAKAKGLEPLARALLLQGDQEPEQLAAAYVDPGKEVASTAEALAGARDIIAEMINENADIRSACRRLFMEEGRLHAHVIKGKEEEGIKFKDYFEWEEPLAKMPSHRFLAIRRGRDEGVLMVKITGVEEAALAMMADAVITSPNSPAAGEVQKALEDGYHRLLALSLQVETMIEYKKKADAQAIQVFASNLRALLLASPLGAKRVLAIDPGFRTGCKLACLDAQGQLQFHGTIFPTLGRVQQAEAAKVVRALIDKYEIEFIALGNGTASRETEVFLRDLEVSQPIVMVNESGASIYSASEVARQEMPDKDITVRGAVSIGRRLMDPLAELVKIDPKSIGVGQYQHDVDQKALKQNLDDVVFSCVNSVGVEVNTASKQLLTYVSGLGPKLAENVMAYRQAKGPFQSRQELKQVPLLGEKAFEQAAGFLRIAGAINPLDKTAVHPERYALVEKMALDLSCEVGALIADKTVRAKINLQAYVSRDVGLPTLTDIMAELEKPGRDPRKAFEVVAFADGVHSPADLKPGMELPGVVTNVTNFGAFVDIGVHQDGLVHISELCDQYIRDPKDYIRVQQRVNVKVLDVDLKRQRIALSMKGLLQPEGLKLPLSSHRDSRPARPVASPRVFAEDWKNKLSRMKTSLNKQR